MEDFEALKGVLIKTVIVVLGISFMGRVVTWDGEANLLNYGIAIGAVVAALSFFLSVKSEGDKVKAEVDQTEAETDKTQAEADKAAVNETGA